MFSKAHNYFYWFKREIFTPYNPAKIYNDLISKNKYEVTIDYEERVMSFKDALAQLPNNPKKILDLATGTGAIPEALENKKNIVFIGMDISTGMLSVAKKRFKSKKNFTFKKADFTKLKFPPQSFDLITMSYATRFIPREFEQQFARNMASWLKKDGIFMAVVNGSPFEQFSIIASRITGIPRGYNLPMNWRSYFIQAMKPYLKLIKEYKLELKNLPLDNIALYFQKR